MPLWFGLLFITYDFIVIIPVFYMRLFKNCGDVSRPS